MNQFTRKTALAAIFMLFTASCTSGSPNPDGEEAESEGEAEGEGESEAEAEGEAEAESESEAESEGESEGDQPCPEEGCETEMPCADDGNCPGDDPCRDYFCDGRDGYCRYWLTDVDGDGYVRESCGGEDCDDRPTEECDKIIDFRNCGQGVHPGAEEDCNGTDDDCDDEVDEDLVGKSCGPKSEAGICRFGTRSCQEGYWTNCVGAVYPEEQESCDGLDNDCDGEVDNYSESCTAVGGCEIGNRICEDGSWGPCDAPLPTPTETNCDVDRSRDCTIPESCPGTDTDCDGLRGCEEDEDCRGQECTWYEGDWSAPGICVRYPSGVAFCNWAACDLTLYTPTEADCGGGDTDCDTLYGCEDFEDCEGQECCRSGPGGLSCGTCIYGFDGGGGAEWFCDF